MTDVIMHEINYTDDISCVFLQFPDFPYSSSRVAIVWTWNDKGMDDNGNVYGKYSISASVFSSSANDIL